MALSMRIIWLSLVACVLSACAAPGGPPKPVEVEGLVIASTELNPDLNGRPSPVVVRIYQLRAAGAFDGADFFELYRKESETLGADLISSDELKLQPGESRPYKTEFDPGARYLGVLAAFRDLGSASWRASVEVPEDKLLDFFSGNDLRIVLDALSVDVSVGK